MKDPIVVFAENLVASLYAVPNTHKVRSFSPEEGMVKFEVTKTHKKYNETIVMTTNLSEDLIYNEPEVAMRIALELFEEAEEKAVPPIGTDSRMEVGLVV